MSRIKHMINKLLTFFMVLISLFGLGACDSNKNTSELTQYGVNISDLSCGIVLESKINNDNDFTSVRLSTGNPKAYETYYFIYRFKATSLEEIKEDNKLIVHLSFDNEACEISKGIMIQNFSKGENLKFDLLRNEDDATELISRVELPKEKSQTVDVTIAWKFFCDFDKLKYTLSFGSKQLETDGSKLRISKSLTTRKATYEKPRISFDEESNSITWETVKNAHHYIVYINGEELGCDPEREDSYAYIGKQNETGIEHLSLTTLKSLGVSGKVKVKIKMEPHHSALANPVESNTITINVE